MNLFKTRVKGTATEIVYSGNQAMALPTKIDISRYVLPPKIRESLHPTTCRCQCVIIGKV